MPFEMAAKTARRKGLRAPRRAAPQQRLLRALRLQRRRWST